MSSAPVSAGEAVLSPSKTLRLGSSGRTTPNRRRASRLRWKRSRPTRAAVCAARLSAGTGVKWRRHLGADGPESCCGSVASRVVAFPLIYA